MARPQKQTVDYFPHQVSKGKTKLILQNEFGNDGYAFWFQLLELLCVSDNQVFDYNNPASWRLLLAETHVTEDNAIKILQLLADLKAIDAELHKSKIIWSQNLVENLELVYKRRATGTPKKPVIANINPPSRVVSVNKSTQTKLNKTKLNNTTTVIFNHWNSKTIRVHRKLTDEMKRAINACNKDFSLDEILQSIDNYALILHGEEYGLMTYSWTLKEFLTGERVEKFLDLKIAQQNYRMKGGKNGTHQRSTRGYTAAELRKSVER